MSTSDFQPAPDPFRHCLTCAHLARMDYRADAALCGHPQHGGLHAGWRAACAFWMREIGTTDEVMTVAVDEEAWRQAVVAYEAKQEARPRQGRPGSPMKSAVQKDMPT